MTDTKDNSHPGPKPRLEFNRKATPDDSFKREELGRHHAATIKGTDERVQTTKQKILEGLFIDESDRQDDGSYAYEKGTVKVSLRPVADGKNWHLSITTTRTPKPVILGLSYEAPEGEDGPFIVTKGFVNHRNGELDNQFVNNPEMHDFAIYSAYKEIRREKDPVWWHGHLKEYDKEHGTNYADAYWQSLGDGAPKIAPIH